MFVSTAHRAIVVPYMQAIANLMPHAKRVSFGGQDMLAMPHRVDETLLLRAHDVQAPAPILHHYDWCGGKPFQVQKNTAAMLTTERRAYVLNGFGTGKTKTALWAADFLMKQRAVRKMVVVGPLSTLNFTWAREILDTVPHRRVVVLHGSREKRLRMAKDPNADIFVVNHDGLAIVGDALLARGDIDLCVLDELAVYRNGSATRTKVTAKFLRNVKWAWGMTGSPTPNAPTDAHAQIRMLTPARVDGSIVRFREATMVKISQFKYVAKRNAVDIVHAAMQPSVRYTLDDVVELPDCVVRDVPVVQGAQQQQVYSAMVQQAQAQWANGEITAANEGVVRMKLLQIAGGWVYTQRHGVVRLDNQGRVDALLDALAACERKVIMFAAFRHTVEGLYAEVAKHFDARMVHGDVPARERNDTFNLFQRSANPRVLVAHPMCMAHGLTLTAADTVMWAGPTDDLEIFDQANARITRIGQKNKQQILLFGGTKVEQESYNRLRNKQKVQGSLLKLFEDATSQ